MAAVVGAAAWLVSWVLNTATRDNTVLVLGKSEGDYRLYLDPVFVVLMLIGLTVLRGERRVGNQRGSLGVGLIVFGLGAMLVGNLVEFGLDGMIGRDKDVGFVLFLIGYLAVIPIGGVLLSWSRAGVLAPLGRVGAGVLIGTPIGLAAPIAGHVIFAAAWALIGIGILRSHDIA
ncbi:MAG: hypothetical protein ABI620_09810, partial [Chloroflexota bacterium]